MNQDKDNSFILRKKTIIIGAIALAIVVLCMIGTYIARHFHYTDIKIVDSKEGFDSISEYVSFNDNVVLYSGDGVSLLDSSLKTVWNYTATFSSPQYDACGKYFIIYDKNATQLAVFQKDGNAGAFSCDKTIAKAKCAGNGCVAVLMSDGSGDLLKYYSKDGSKIAEISFDNKSQGYPVDFDVTDDGKGIIVSMERVSETGLSGDLLYYDLSGDISGMSESASVSLSDNIIPSVNCMSDGRIAALLEDGFAVYSYNGDLKQVSKVDFEDEIVSAFFNDNNIGFIFDGDTAKYKVIIYNTGGKSVARIDLDHSYNEAVIDVSRIIISNASQFSVFSTGGILKLSANSVDGDIQKIIRLGENKYMCVKQNSIEVIKGAGFGL